MCIDPKHCSIQTPIQQLITFLTNFDRKLATIDPEVFLEQMIGFASEDAMLLHMHQSTTSPCENDSNDTFHEID